MSIKTTPLVRNFTAIHLDDDKNEQLKKRWDIFRNGQVKVNPGGWLFPAGYTTKAHLVINFKFRKSDVIIMSFPKSGTTWTQELAWNLLHNPNQDNPDAYRAVDIRAPDFEFGTSFSVDDEQKMDPDEAFATFDIVYPGCRKETECKDNVDVMFEIFNNMPSPRMLKNHHPISLLAEDVLDNAKVIYIARNVYDTAISMYFFIKLHTLWGFTGTLDEYVDDFTEDRVPFSPYFQHLKVAWERREHPNMLFLYYEDLKEDIKREIRKIDNFIGTNRTDDQIKRIAEFTSFDNLKERSKENPPTSNKFQYHSKENRENDGGTFYRKGQVGNWKEHFTESQRLKLKNYADKNMKMFGDDFKYKKNQEFFASTS